MQLHSFVHRFCSQLFGEDEDAGGELDVAEKQGENGMFLMATVFFVLIFTCINYSPGNRNSA